MTDLAEQIKIEQEELDSLPKIPLSELMPKSTGMHGRCSFCGRFRTDLEPFDVFHGVERSKGGCCGGRSDGVAK
jgi:hypothetical protein